MLSNHGSHFRGRAVNDLVRSLGSAVERGQSPQILRCQRVFLKKGREHLIGPPMVATQAGYPGAAQAKKR